jgi:hypothetical protein
MEKSIQMFEGNIITSNQLKNEWISVLSTYDSFINGGHKLRPVRFIVRYIIGKGYDSVLFPGTSMYSLLISIPIDNKVNFNKTLKINFDPLTEKLTFKFIDRTIGRIGWEDTCQATEGSDLLETFLTDNEDFRRVQRIGQNRLMTPTKCIRWR